MNQEVLPSTADTAEEAPNSSASIESHAGYSRWRAGAQDADAAAAGAR